MDFKAEIKGGNLIITIPVKTDIKVDGYPLTIGLNAYITNAEYVPPAK